MSSWRSGSSANEVPTSKAFPVSMNTLLTTVSVASGFEYRKESGAEINPGFNQTGIGGGNATAPTNGSFDVSEFYAEVNVPVVDMLILDAAVRVGDYSTVGSQTTWNGTLPSTAPAASL